MQCKDKDEGLEVSPLDMLLVILLQRASMTSCVVKPSSPNPLFAAKCGLAKMGQVGSHRHPYLLKFYTNRRDFRANFV